MAQNGLTLDAFGGGAFPRSRPNHERLFRLAAAVGMVLLGLLAMFGVSQFAAYIGKHHHHNLELIVVGVMAGSVPIGVFLFFVLSEGYVLLRALLKQLQWWHILWALLFMSGLIFRKRSSTEASSTPVDSAAAYRIGLVFIVGAYLLVALFMRRINWLKSMLTGIPGILTWFTMVCAVSTLWSVYWEWTFYKACEYSVDVALLATVVYVMKSTSEVESFVEFNWLLFGLLLCAVWFWAIVDPADALSSKLEYGTEGLGIIGVQLIGVLPDVSANAIGEMGAVMGAIALARLLPFSRQRRNSLWYYGLFGFGLMTMFFAQCRSAICGWCMAVFVIFLFSRRIIQGAITFFAGVFVFLATGLGSVAWKYLERGQSSAQMSSLSERLSWWSVAWEKFTDHPLTGLGAWAAGRFGVLAKLGHKMTATMHSDWVEMIVGTGIWGIIPIAVMVIWTWWILIRFIQDPETHGILGDLCLECIGVMGVMTVRMFFMTDLTWHPPLLFFAPMGFAEYIRRRSRYGEKHHPKLLFTP